MREYEVKALCGICGILNLDRNHFVDESVLVRMRDTMIHRGPDEAGNYVKNNLGLAIRRLSIIDLDTGQQPVHNEEFSIWMVFNGEIYNYKELQDKLTKAGHVFYTKSDTECIVHSYEDLGLDFISVLNGMFAIALWDSTEKQLILVRDRVGKKPLYYYCDENHFLFASELKALLAHPAVKAEIDLEAVSRFLCFGYVPTPYSIIKNIQKLEPAHMLVFREGKLTIRRYWECPFSAHTIEENISEGDALERLDELLRDAVRIRLRCDVPFGAFLSGGIDSSIIVSSMTHFMDISKMHTFSIGFEDKSHDESRFAHMVADRFGTYHHTETFDHKEFLNLLPDVVRFMDEPLGDPSVFPTYFLSRLTRQHVKVALSGDGGDELFAGYHTFNICSAVTEWYQRDSLLQTFKRIVVKNLPWFRQAHARIKIARQSRWLTKYPVSLWGYLMLQGFTPNEVGTLFFYDKQMFEAAETIHDDIMRVIMSDGSVKATRVLQHFYLHFYLLDDILTKVDRTSMSASLEVRSPLLDYRILEFAARLPSALKISKDGIRKYIFKKFAATYLPEEVINRSKQGFSIPLTNWFRGHLLDLLKDSIHGSSIIDTRVADRFIQEHLKGEADHWQRLFSLLMLHLWCNQYLSQ